MKKEKVTEIVEAVETVKWLYQGFKKICEFHFKVRCLPAPVKINHVSVDEENREISATIEDQNGKITKQSYPIEWSIDEAFQRDDKWKKELVDLYATKMYEFAGIEPIQMNVLYDIFYNDDYLVSITAPNNVYARKEFREYCKKYNDNNQNKRGILGLWLGNNECIDTFDIQ